MPVGADAPGSRAGEEEAVGALVGGVADAGSSRAFARPLAKTSPSSCPGPTQLVSLLVEELTRGGVAAAVREQGPVEGRGGARARPRRRSDRRGRAPAPRRDAGGSAGRRGGPRDGGRADARPLRPRREPRARPRSGTGFPVDEIARRLARALGEEATPLAARLPALREAVCEELIRKFSRQNAFLGVVVFVPGADLPILTANQVRLVLRIADAHGFEIDRERLPEVLAVIASGFGFRALARKAIAYRPLRRLGGEGRGRLRGHARARRGRGALLRTAGAGDAGRGRARALSR